MAACVCYRCHRVMECSRERYCELCKYDLEQVKLRLSPTAAARWKELERKGWLGQE